MSGSNKEQQLPMQTYSEPQRRREEEVVYQQTSQVTPTQATFIPPKDKENTKFSQLTSKMTRGEVIWGITAIVFFFAFFAAPDSPLFFFAVIIVAIIAWNVSEREKMKGHIASILQLYPNTSVSFMTQQLSKKEDKVIKVVRMMILEDGYPIKLDLVNNTIHKVGKFPEEFTQTYGPGATFATAIPDDAPVSTPAPHRPTSSLAQAPGPVARSVEPAQLTPEPQPEPAPQVVEEDLPTRTTEGPAGQIREPMLYCSACGAPLKAEVKYCYICGARQ